MIARFRLKTQLAALIRKLMDELDHRSEGGRNIPGMVMGIAPTRPKTRPAGADA